MKCDHGPHAIKSTLIVKCPFLFFQQVDDQLCIINGKTQECLKYQRTFARNFF